MVHKGGYGWFIKGGYGWFIKVAMVGAYYRWPLIIE